MAIYLDNSATTKPCKAAADTALKLINDEFGNPSSLHFMGFEADRILGSARQTVADSLKVEPSCIYFTPSGTAANNTAVFGAAGALRRRGNRIVTTAIEHPSVARCIDALEAEGFEVVRLAPDTDGNISVSQFENAVNEKTVLVSLMAVNNEVGSVLPFDKIKKVITRKSSPALLHVDAIQGYMKLDIKPEKCGIDLMSMSAHKIHGLKGAGALYIRKGVRILPHILGGGQENGIVSGTQAMPNIAAFAAAVESLGSIEKRYEHVKALNAYLREQISDIDFVTINSPEEALPYILNISLIGIPSQVSVNYFSQNGICVSAGSACAKGHRSDTLTAMGLSNERIDSAIRVSFSYENTKDEMDCFVSKIKDAGQELLKR